MLFQRFRPFLFAAICSLALQACGTNPGTEVDEPQPQDLRSCGCAGALLVVGAGPLSAGDKAIAARLTGIGLQVTRKTDRAAKTADAVAKCLVFISSTAKDTNVGKKFSASATAVLTTQVTLQDELDMTGPRNAVLSVSPSGQPTGNVPPALSDQGTIPATALSLLVAGPLSGGLVPSAYSMYATQTTIGWGFPSGEATVVTTTPSRKGGWSGLPTSYVFEQGRRLSSGQLALGKRGFFYAVDAAVSGQSATSWTLFDAMVSWSLGTPVGTASPVVVCRNPYGGTLRESWPCVNEIPGATYSWVAVNRSGPRPGDTLPNNTPLPEFTGACGPHMYPPINYTYEVTITQGGCESKVTISNETPADISNPLCGTGGPTSCACSGALMVVGNLTLSAADQAVEDRLRSLNLAVTKVEDAVAKPSDADRPCLVFITDSANPANVGTKFNDAVATVFTNQPTLQDELDMTGSQYLDLSLDPSGKPTPGYVPPIPGDPEHGTVPALDITVSPGPFSGGLVTGTVGSSMAMFPAQAIVGWGWPGASALVTSTTPPRRGAYNGHPTSYVYDQGKSLNSGALAPGKRGFFYAFGVAVTSQTSSSWTLFDAMINWGLTDPTPRSCP
jgi:hypothetical protein